MRLPHLLARWVPAVALVVAACGQKPTGGKDSLVSVDLGGGTETGGRGDGTRVGDGGRRDGAGGSERAGSGDRAGLREGGGRDGRRDGGRRADLASGDSKPNPDAYVPCGTPGLMCCESIACLSGACCVGGTCTAPGSSCGGSTVCESGSCVACGGAHEVCCAPSGSGAPSCSAPNCCVGGTCLPEGASCGPSAGQCVSGSCEIPTAIAIGQASPYDLRVAGTTAVWANTSTPGCARTMNDCGQVISTPTSSVKSAGKLLASLIKPYFVSTNGASVGVSCNGFDQVSTDTLPLAGGAVAIIFTSASCAVPGGASAPSGCAMNGTTFYWADPFLGLFSSAIGGATCGGAKLEGGHPYAVAVDASHVYWSDTASTSLFSASLAGGKATTVATGVGRVFFLATDGTNLYFTDNFDGVVGQVPVGGASTFTTLSTGESSPLGIAVDATTVYWADNGGTIQRVPIGGGTEVVLATAQAAPVGLALDAGNVYWANNTSGEIMKLAK